MKKTVFTKMVMAVIFCTFWVTGFAQIKTLHLSSNTFINDRVWENNDLGLLWWKCDSMLEGQLFTTHIIHTGLTTDDQMIIAKEWTDKQVCLNHRKYQHYYKGIEVEGSEYREHYQDNGMVILSNGLLAEGLDLTVTPEITEETALTNALAHIGATTYAWEDDSMEYWLSQDSVATVNTYYPDGKLVLALTGDRKIKASNYVLAWKFRIFAIDPHYDMFVYVDASTGNVIQTISPVCSGDFNHVHYGNGLYLDTRWYGGLRSKYFLHANDNGRNIKTKDDKYYGLWWLSSLPDDKNDHWHNDHWGATSSHYVVQEAWAMFQNTYGRNGMDDNNSEIRVHGNDASAPNNAWYSPDNGFDRMSFGSAGGNLLATLDIGGHEFTHGVDEHSGSLVYQDESGALDESFADIFGFMTERYVQGNADWTIGEDANFTIRDMQNPNAFNHPAWYLQPNFWFTGTADFGGVHTNSGVQNRYFNLLSMGGTQLGRTVQGVGIDIAAEVTYYSFTNLTGSNETYPQAREHAVAAARILYGVCSFVENQVCRAWSACNIGPYCDPCAVWDPCWDYGCGVNQGMFISPNNEDKLIDQNSQNYNEQVSIEKNREFNKEFRLNTISLYPNPTKNDITVDLGEITYGDKESLEYSIEIVDIFGKTVYSEIVEPSQSAISIDVSGYRKGVYQVILRNRESNKVLRFMKQ